MYAPLRLAEALADRVPDAGRPLSPRPPARRCWPSTTPATPSAPGSPSPPTTTPPTGPGALRLQRRPARPGFDRSSLVVDGAGDTPDCSPGRPARRSWPRARARVWPSSPGSAPAVAEGALQLPSRCTAPPSAATGRGRRAGCSRTCPHVDAGGAHRGARGGDPGGRRPLRRVAARRVPAERRSTSELFHAALEASAARLAHAVGAGHRDWSSPNAAPDAVLVSLARAGTPVGILMRRWARYAHGLDLPHYAVSIVRGRGIDAVALRYLAAHHDPASRGVRRRLDRQGRHHPRARRRARRPHPASPADLAVLADPGRCVAAFGTRDDFLIPSACLNSTVSGLVSRTVLNADLIGPDDFHGAKFYRDLAGDDVSALFLDTVARPLRRRRRTRRRGPAGATARRPRARPGRAGRPSSGSRGATASTTSTWSSRRRRDHPGAAAPRPVEGPRAARTPGADLDPHPAARRAARRARRGGRAGPALRLHGPHPPARSARGSRPVTVRAGRARRPRPDAHLLRRRLALDGPDETMPRLLCVEFYQAQPLSYMTETAAAAAGGRSPRPPCSSRRRRAHPSSTAASSLLEKPAAVRHLRQRRPPPRRRRGRPRMGRGRPGAASPSGARRWPRSGTTSPTTTRRLSSSSERIAVRPVRLHRRRPRRPARRPGSRTSPAGAPNAAGGRLPPGPQGVLPARRRSPRPPPPRRSPAAPAPPRCSPPATRSSTPSSCGPPTASIRPAHGELHDAGWSAPGTAVTAASGIAAGQEIAEWLLERATAP